MKQVFNDLIKQDVKPLLKEHGYAKKGLHFSKATDAMTYIISFQKSAGNSADQVMFYVNCGIYSAELAEIQGKAVKDAPAEVECHFRERIEHIAQGVPARYELTEATDIDSVRQSLRSGLVQVLDFYAQMSDARSIVDYYRAIPALHLGEEGMRLLIRSGEPDAARAYVAALRDKHGEETRWTIFEGKYQAIFAEYGEDIGA